MALLKSLNQPIVDDKSNKRNKMLEVIEEQTKEVDARKLLYTSRFSHEALHEIISNTGDVDISKNRYVPGFRVRGETSDGWIYADLLDHSIGFKINPDHKLKTKNGNQYVTLCGVETKQIDALILLLLKLKESRSSLIGPILDCSDVERYDDSDTDDYDDDDDDDE